MMAVKFDRVREELYDYSNNRKMLVLDKKIKKF
jgi:hypothetical protein